MPTKCHILCKARATAVNEIDSTYPHGANLLVKKADNRQVKEILEIMTDYDEWYKAKEQCTKAE